MRDALILAADIFIAATAVFGVFCFAGIIISGRAYRKNLRRAIYINDISDIDRLENIIFEADFEFFEQRQEKYALIWNTEPNDRALLDTIPEKARERIEIYVRPEE